MKTPLCIAIILLSCSSLFGQELTSQKVPKLTVDDKQDGYAIFSYKIPSDGNYVFSVDGGLLPKKSCTIYYCEYQLELKSQDKQYRQELSNIATQAQDGNVFYFNANQKNNKVAGTFKKDETVEFRLVVLRSDVNGQPHHELSTTDNTLVSVQQITPGSSHE